MIPVQFITHSNERYSYTEGAQMAIEGGCKWIQLRMKDASDEDVLAAAAVIQPLCKAHDAVFVLDDRVELAKRIKADGVHLGKHDMPVDEARRILGEDAIIGGTANTYEDVERLYRQGADYIGCGPLRYTTTKQNLSPVLGMDGYRNIISSMKANNIALPLVAIGGVVYDDIPLLVAMGVRGVAVSGVILNADNPTEEMRRMIHWHLSD